jgi:adenylosuccinate lyase
VTIPDSFLALDYMLDRFVWIVEGLVVYPERMLKNLDTSHGLFFSHRLLLALVEAGLDRREAYRLVQRNAMRAWDEERDFGELVRGEAEISSLLDAVALDAVFDLQSTVQHVDAVFERLRVLTSREGVVHV